MALSEYGVFQNPSVSSIYVSLFNGHTLVVTSFSDTPNYHIRCLFTYFVDCIIYPHDTPMISPWNPSKFLSWTVKPHGFDQFFLFTRRQGAVSTRLPRGRRWRPCVCFPWSQSQAPAGTTSRMDFRFVGKLLTRKPSILPWHVGFCCCNFSAKPIHWTWRYHTIWGGWNLGTMGEFTHKWWCFKMSWEAPGDGRFLARDGYRCGSIWKLIQSRDVWVCPQGSPKNQWFTKVYHIQSV